MALILVVAEELSALITSAPSASDIAAAFRAARLGPRVEDGDWIGPAPRVTRVAEIGALRGFHTRAAWLYGWPAGGPWDTRAALVDLRRALVERVNGKLAQVSGGWRPAEAVVWTARVNGSLEWWRDGSAAVTRTRDEFPTGAGRLDPTEKLDGPTTPESHPSTLGELGGRAARSLRGAGRGVGRLAVVGVGLFIGFKVLSED
jgi:hypothetical protein